VPVAVVAFVGSSLGGFIAAEMAIAGTFKFMAIKAAVAFGFSSIAGEVLGLGAEEAPASSMDSRGFKFNTSTTNSPIPVAYGRMVVGGNVTLRDLTSGNSDYLHTVLVLSEGEIEGFIDVLIDSESMRDKNVLAENEIDYPAISEKFRVSIDGVVYTADTIPLLVADVQAISGYSSFDWEVTQKSDTAIRFYENLPNELPEITTPRFYHAGKWKSSYTEPHVGDSGDSGGSWGGDFGGGDSWGDDGGSYGGYSDAGGGFGV
jgi:hypothetical protein